MNNVTAYFDGSCEPVNPGGTAKWGFVVLDDHGDILHAANGTVGKGKGMTSNVAEYHGILNCLSYLHQEHRDDFLEVFGDSLMVVNMVNGTWGKKGPHRKMPHLIPLVLQARNLKGSLPSCSIEWIPRELNTLADHYSKID